MLHTPNYNTLHKTYIFLALLFIMSQSSNSAQNTNSTENSHPTPYTPDTLDYCLVGRLLSTRPVRFHNFKTRMSTLWQPKHQVDITQMEPNRFMFQFFNYADMERVIQQGPWLFDSYPLIWSKVTDGKDPFTMPIDSIELWVQVHNLPFGFMTETMGILLGNHIGKLVKYDHDNNYGNWRRYMRLRVSLPAKEPLKKSFEFVLEDGAVIRVNFRYEKPGNFCYECGLIGHTDGSCPKRFEKGFVEGQQQWGPYLRSDYVGPEGGMIENPWLHDGRNRGRRAWARAAECSNLHRIFGRVKIGRDMITRGLVFYRHIGALYDSNEWVRFNVESVSHTPDAAQPDGSGTFLNSSMQIAGPTTRETQLIEGDEARIARLIQEARLKNPVMIETAMNNPIGSEQNVLEQQPISQLAASLAQILHTGLPKGAEPRRNGNGVLQINKPDGPKQLKRLRLEESETSAEEIQKAAETAEITRTDSSHVIESVDVVMNESATAANANVMAGPGHQARQEK